MQLLSPALRAVLLGGLPRSTGNDQYTKLLMHFDGADAGTTMTDSNAGGSAHTWTARGNAQLDTDQSKFGGSSLLCDGTTDWIDTPDHADFTLGSGDWTFDCWLRANSTGARRTIAGQSDSSASAASVSIWFERQLDDTFRMLVGNAGSLITLNGTIATTTGAWYHLAGVRYANRLMLFVNGAQQISAAISGAVHDSATIWSLGQIGDFKAADGIPNWDGWIEEARLSVGIARWTSNFAPPAAPYS